MNGNWVKLYRKILESDMYKSLKSKERDVMIVCLLSAWHKEREYLLRNDLIKLTKGQFVTSLSNLKKMCAKDVSIQSLRTALLNLEKWHFLTNESTSSGRLITIVKWEDYQSSDLESTSKSTNDQQSTNKALNKNDKNDKNIYTHVLSLLIQEELIFKSLRGLRDQLTDDQAIKLEKKYGLDKCVNVFKEMENYNKINSKVSVYLTADSWLRGK